MASEQEINALLQIDRREMAKAALNGLCSALEDYNGNRVINVEAIAQDAIAIADALIAELQKESHA